MEHNLKLGGWIITVTFLAMLAVSVLTLAYSLWESASHNG